MTDWLITIHTDATVDQPTVPVNRKNKDTVTWQADKDVNGKYPKWFIYFQLDPFSDHVIATNGNSGKTSPMKVSPTLAPGTCPYTITDTDPTVLIKRKPKKKKKNVKMFQSGGGIIIDA